jgi:hypothetical protein
MLINLKNYLICNNDWTVIQLGRLDQIRKVLKGFLFWKFMYAEDFINIM